MGGWRVHTGFNVGRGSLGEEGGGRGVRFLLVSLLAEDSGFLLFHFRLKLCRSGVVGGGEVGWRVYAAFTVG